MKVALETDLPIAPETAWDWVQTSALLREITFPLVIFRPIGGPWPERWEETRYRAWMLLFGVLPFGRQSIVITKGEDADGYWVRDNGSGDLVATWDHRITLRRTEDGGTRYADVVEVKAGVLTPVVWAFAAVFYRWRQRRWRRLAVLGFDPTGEA